ncbi:isocitrate lyase/PEP mutase family protein [Halomonas salipaludis]|uniref:Carboxyvinyl-carboxyphosphonate phosphorylmutase n=1 Tax=Halomonas salipaludis TaxID=2032625 RepID=A0A2A2ET66_9GAMM|nr:isocitrate lyase/PEP mutase family protein [Halomonas salipaludis]PAU75579.1 carboxyvinyl-carboxyphosphonate phosphorylmutase [Halomonas salipaludis]
MNSNLRQLLSREDFLVSPGVYDCYSALLAEQAGFNLVSTTGAGMVNARLGMPDVGIFSMRDNVDTVRMIARSVEVPVSADAEAGYGNAATVWYVVREFEAAGAASVSIEDQVMPKRCGHLQGKEVVPMLEMTRKIEAAVAARYSEDFLIIARTDAIATEGVDGAVARAKAYEAAGADVIFPDAVRDGDDIARIVEAVNIPVRINMGFGIRTRTTTPLMAIPDLKRLGVRWISLSRMLPAAAIRGMSMALKVMRESMESGVVAERPDLVADMSEITELMDYRSYFEVERRFLSEENIERKYGTEEKQ